MSGGSDYSYIVYLNHQDIVRSQSITFFDANLRQVITVPPLSDNSFYMDYERGVFTIPSAQYGSWSTLGGEQFLKTYPAGTSVTTFEVITRDRDVLVRGADYVVFGGPIRQRIHVSQVDADRDPLVDSHGHIIGHRQVITIDPAVVPAFDWVRYDDPAVTDPTNPGVGFWILPLNDSGYFTDPQPLLAAISVADYWINFTNGDLQVLFDQGGFLLHESVFPAPIEVDSDDVQPPVRDPNDDKVEASFSFTTLAAPVRDAHAMLDGTADTQTQMLFYAPPFPGTVFATIDLGSEQSIDAIDLVPGYFLPPEDATGLKRFDFSARVSIKYSIDGSFFFPVSSRSLGIDIRTGGSWSAEKDDLGSQFVARYIRIEIDSIDRLDYQDGIWPISIAMLNIYQDIVLRGSAQLVEVVEDEDTQLEDVDRLREACGERTHLVTEPDPNLGTQAMVDQRALDLLTEFRKNHHRAQVHEAYLPGLRPGHTILLNDPANGTSRRYFVEGVGNENGFLTIDLAYYP